MRRSFVFLLLALLLAPGLALGQKDRKLGHIDTQALLKSMPEHDSALMRLKAFEADVMEHLEGLQVEYNRKFNEFQQKRSSWTPAILETKEKEMMEMQQRMTTYQQAATQDFQEMQGKLMQPIVEKMRSAIEKVGKAQGFFYIFDQSLGSLLYISPESVDVLPLVQQELGLSKR